MITSSLVSIICTVYNQENYVLEALNSVKSQDYKNFELIILENGSKDNSAKLIEKWVFENDILPIKVIYEDITLPYCQIFNKGLAISQGKYIMDLSGDDLILPGHLIKSVARLIDSPNSAFCFSDVELFEKGEKAKTFYKRDHYGELINQVKEGYIYKEIIKGNPVLSPSLIFDAEKLKAIGGYDESLEYEDFDVLVRLSRGFPAVFSDHIGVKKRIHIESFSSNQYQPKVSKMLPSTLKVCQKIFELNQDKEENQAIIYRVMYETKHSLWSANFEVANDFIKLAQKLGSKSLKFEFFKIWAKYRFNISGIYTVLKKKF
ncbi:glycosyl transferase [Belliella baltica DSM 15883]|uniref:Glycosyl transferase n=1 Tax=Belliella baltica (strain DSM 15883 / CIP 108006 / LMG 21964 / BA134) TaxID=866536 RepID=I3Z0N0_BELBD|nr:glycosyltransferase [Belliella baltica]AFL82798.1 glycosyl transferase [Belliella baltica DSM 15883]